LDAACATRSRLPAKGRRMVVRRGAIVVLSSVVFAALASAGLTFSTGPERSPILPLTAIFIIPAAIVFGIWGALGAFFANILFNGIPVGLIGGAVDMLLPTISGILARWFRVDPLLPSLRAYLLYAGAVAIAAAAQAAVGSVVGYAMGFIAVDEIPVRIAIYWTKLIVAGLVFAPLLLRPLAALARRTGLYPSGVLLGSPWVAHARGCSADVAAAMRPSPRWCRAR
jgi:hypothetical protein